MRTRQSKKQLLYMMTIIIISTWIINNYFRKSSVHYILRDEAKRLHELNILARIKSEKGTGCKMPKTNPFSADIMKYMKKTPKIRCRGIDWVDCIGSKCYVIKKILDLAPTVECFYRDLIYITDNEYYLEKPVRIKGNDKYIMLRSDHVHVYCMTNITFPFSWNPNWRGWKTGLRDVKVVYKPNPLDSFNVLILCLDSVSHGHFLRKLPLSYSFLTQELGAVVLNSYNVLGDGTPASLFPILTGKSELEMLDTRKINKGMYFNPREFLFEKLHLEGYRTAYFEDSATSGSFQHRYNGFKYPPADHYLRPLFLQATEKLCVGGVPRHALLLNITLQFIKGADKRFCFTFIDSNLIASIEDDLSAFLKAIKVNGILENTVFFLMAGHGYTKFRTIYQEKIEERLPFMTILLPERVKRSVKLTLRANADVLTTPFDIHTTILDAVGLNHLRNIYRVPGSDLPRGLSLLESIPQTRSCAEADVLAHWCACLQRVNVSQSEPIYMRVANEFCAFINSFVAENAMCAKREISCIEWVVRQKHHDQVLKLETDEGYSKSVEPSVEYYQLKIIMSPGRAMFEGTVVYLRNRNHFMVLENEVSRVNAYGDESKCVGKTHPHLSKYCYCVV